MTTSQQKSSIDLVDIAKLQELISAVDDQPPGKRKYLQARWLHQIRWWDQRSRDARRQFFRSRTIIICGGALVPFLISVGTGTSFDTGLRAIAGVLSVVVAIAAGLEALHNWGGVWLEKRNAAELLKVEGWLFMSAAGVYAERPDAFAQFVASVENKIAAEIGQYVKVAAAAVETKDGKPPDAGTPPGSKTAAPDH